MCSLGEEASLFSGFEEPVAEFVEGDLAVAVFVKLVEGFFEGGLVEGAVSADLSVQLHSNLVHFVFFEEAGVVFVEGGEELLDDFGKFSGGDGHLIYLTN